jgi:hypothetical protein
MVDTQFVARGLTYLSNDVDDEKSVLWEDRKKSKKVTRGDFWAVSVRRRKKFQVENTGDFMAYRGIFKNSVPRKTGPSNRRASKYIQSVLRLFTYVKNEAYVNVFIRF